MTRSSPDIEDLAQWAEAAAGLFPAHSGKYIQIAEILRATQPAAPAGGESGEAVQDTWFTDQSLPIMAASGDVEDDRVLKLRFRRKVTDADRKRLIEVLNAGEAALAAPSPMAQSDEGPRYDQSGRRIRDTEGVGTDQCSAVIESDWRDNPSSDERWQEGCNFAMEQLCDYLGVDPKSVSWDAATETLDGDVQAVIGNILRQKYGEDWGVSDGAIYAAVSKANTPEVERSEILREIDARINRVAQAAPNREAVLKAIIEAQDCGVGDTGPDGKWRRIACNDDSLKGDRNYFREDCDCSRATDAVLARSSTQTEPGK